MKKPVILTVDDEPSVLSAVARDLRGKYGADYRIVRAGSGEEALEALGGLRLREEPVALLLVDQRMPGITGVEVLREAVQLHPGAKRVLLTAYSDTDVAIRAINEIRLDHYLLKPWSPPEEHLYPVLTDLLDDWRAAYDPPIQGLRVVDHQWSPHGHRVKDFLVRNLVPYRWLDLDDDPEAVELLELVGLDVRLPVVVFEDGTHLDRPDNAEIARRIGLQTEAEADTYDLIIVGGGPAGLAAAVYGASEGLRTLLVEREAPGGQAGMSSRIENYLGFPAGLSGGELTRRAVAQATRLGAEILTPREATGIELEGDYRVVCLDDGERLHARAVLVTTGVSYRRLQAPGADRLAGAGVYYGAATTESRAVRGEDVFVVGGGNSAGQGAMYLSRFARCVTLLVRDDSLSRSMSDYLISQISETENVVVRTRVQVEEIHGETFVEGVTFRDLETGEDERLPGRAVFVFIGAAPRTDWLAGLVERDPRGFILSGPDVMRERRRPRGWNAGRPPLWLETSVPGIFAAGDVRRGSVKRVASAVGEGAMAVQFVHVHLKGPVMGRPSAADTAPEAPAAVPGNPQR